MLAIDLDLDHDGCLAFVGGFWRRVVRDLAGEPIYFDNGAVAPGPLVRACTLAWLLGDEVAHDAAGRPVSFRAWCRFGGLDLDPVWWRGCLLSGEAPGYLKREDA